MNAERRRIAWAFLGASACAWAVPSWLHAQPAPSPNSAEVRPVHTEVLVVLGSEAEGQIDPSLAEFSALRRPPFNAFRSMSMLGRNEMELAVDRPVDLPLPNGRQVHIELDAVTEEGRYRVRVSINSRDRADYLPVMHVLARPGEPFFVAGQSFRGGTLVVGVRIGRRVR